MTAHDPKLGSGQPQDFATTRWSLVLSAGSEREQAHGALSELCATYWMPLYAYARRRSIDVSEAQDLTQAFFVELLEKDYVATARPERGRFRAYLLTAFKHFLSKQWEQARAQKRGAGKAPISLDFAAADSSLNLDPAGGLTPEQIFDRQWATTLLNSVMGRLEAEFDRAGKRRQLEALKAFLIGEHVDATYAQGAHQLGISESAVKQAVSRMRRRYRQFLREAISETVSGPGEIDDEVRNLFAVFQT